MAEHKSITELHDAVFVVGALDEALMLRGMRYHPVDIEATVIRCQRKVIEWSVSNSVPLDFLKDLTVFIKYSEYNSPSADFSVFITFQLCI